MAQLSPAGPVLVIAASGEIQDVVLSAVAAQELEAEVATEASASAETWRTASVVVVADDQAERLAARALPHREGVYLVGSHPELLSVWSAPLSAQVIRLPEGAAWLGAVLEEGSNRAGAPVVTVVGGSGGAGASTLAAAMAQLSAARGDAGAALVDADPIGGGIDLLLGAERVEGWRWSRLHAAEGHVGDLRAYLPVVDGVSVVAMPRDSPIDLAREPLAAIVSALRGWHSLVVLDPGRANLGTTREALRLATRQLLVVAASVRGVAAARQLTLSADLSRAAVVVRRLRGGLPSGLVAEALELPLLAELPDESGLVGAAERGEPPARGSRRGYRRAVEKLLRDLPGEDRHG